MPRPKIELFQWSADTVQKELGFKRETFLRNAAEQNITPSEQGKYTSKQVFRAMTGDARRRLEQERLLLVQQQRQKLEFENDESAGRLVDKDVVLHTYGEIFSYIRTTIFSSKLTEQEKRDLAVELQRIVTETPEWAKRLAGRQTVLYTMLLWSSDRSTIFEQTVDTMGVCKWMTALSISTLLG